MKCPACKDVTLSMSSRNEIEIDFCPTCRGVWLDRGELDKIIEKTAQDQSRDLPRASEEQPQHRIVGVVKPYGDDQRHHDHYKYKRKKSFLEELFD